MVGLFFGLKTSITIDEFFLQNTVPRLDASIVVAIAFSAHTGLHLVCF